MNHLDFVKETLGPEGFQAFCKGNALLLLLGGEPAEAGEYVALLSEPAPKPPGSTQRCPSVAAPAAHGGLCGNVSCELVPGHAGDHQAGSITGRYRYAWDGREIVVITDSCPVPEPTDEELLGGVREPERRLSAKERVDLNRDWRQLLLRQGETRGRCAAPATPEGHQPVKCEFPTKHGDGHVARSVNGRYIYAWDGAAGAVEIVKIDEPTDEELLAVLEDTDSQPTDKQWRLIADRMDAVGEYCSTTRGNPQRLTVCDREQLARLWRSKL